MKKIVRFFKSIKFKIPMLFVVLLLISLQLILTNFMSQLETQTMSSFQEQIQLQVGFLKNSIQPVLATSDTTTKAKAISQILQDYPTGSSILEARVIDSHGYILGTTDQSVQAIVGTKSTDQDVQEVLLSKTPRSYEYQQDGVRYWRLVSVIESTTDSLESVGVILVRANIESRYKQLQDIGLLFVNAGLVAILITSVISFLISRGIIRPISAMKQQAEKISEGHYSDKIEIYSDDELGQLGQTINELSIKVRDAQATTEAERKRLDSILRHMSDGVVGTNREGRIITANSAALRLLGATSEQIIGKMLLEVLHIDQITTLGQILGERESMLTYTNDEGTILQYEFSTIQRDSGFINGIVCVLTDITEREKIERERRNFVSNVSHELRTPLTSIRSYTEALVDGAWENPEVAPEFLGVIEQETDRMMRMISSLLSLSRMDQSRLELDKEYVNMNDLISHIVSRFDMMLQSEPYREKNYRIVLDITPRTLWAEIDQDKMIQVFDNIINNAIKYSPDGGRIIVRLMETHDHLIVSISDEGIGVPQKDIPHLFDRFYRVDKARSREMGGSGLGLAIAKEVVELHGGKIWLTSTEGKGSTFYVSLGYDTFEGEEEDDWL